MKTGLLFNVPKDSPSKHEKLASFKDRHGIWTHRADIATEDLPWCAMLVPKARERLSGYGPKVATMLPIELIADFCRLLEESDLLICGRFEREAIRILCERNGIQFTA